ncbi:MarR family winged helix-turn-helix transcriptional regulator [Cohnella sp. REN36]|uniref:MarR family winged helix-turn-helix transcriptional regulator n=1 Tax=Cohnella sp. REN36 TaxID=2887347 RepID=UPI001D15D066|nr:MarR family transcriptional regulator [Cohnella sp. REN36]MCC3371550.1 MarR family transcriptional regulator [Cohnella sp. REN36]
MTPDRLDPVHELMGHFSRLAKLDWHKLTSWRLKASEVRVLVAIREAAEDGQPITVTALSKRLRVTSPTVTQMINSLIRERHVVRTAHPSDGRIAEIRLTDTGESIAREASEVLVGLFQGLIDYLGEEQSRELIQLLGRSIDYFKQISEAER